MTRRFLVSKCAHIMAGAVLVGGAVAVPGCGSEDPNAGKAVPDDTQDRTVRNKAMEDYMKSQNQKK